MIKHYILLSAEFTDVPEGESPFPAVQVKIDFDHSMLLSGFGGVAFDTDTKTWLSPSQLTNEESENDAVFLNLVSQSICSGHDHTEDE